MEPDDFLATGIQKFAIAADRLDEFVTLRIDTDGYPVEFVRDSDGETFSMDYVRSWWSRVLENGVIP